MAATRVQASTVASISSGTTLAASWPAATTAGNLLVVVIGFNNWPTTPSFGAHADWGDPIFFGEVGTGGAVRPGVAVYAIYEAASRSGSESFNPSGDSDCVLQLLEYSTDHASDPLVLVSEGTAQSSAGSSTASSGTTSPSALCELVLAPINSRPFTADQTSPTNSFTAVSETETRDHTEGVHLGIYERLPNTTSTFETSVTLASTTYWIGAALAFAPGTPPEPLPLNFVTSAGPATANPTTSFTVTIPTVAVDDLLILEFTHRGIGNGSVSDDDTGGETWTHKGSVLYATDAFSGQHYYKRATGSTSGKTITVTSLTNSSAPVLTVYRGVVASGDPFEAWSAEANASGNETHAELTTLTDFAMVCLTVFNTPDLAIASQATTSPGVLTERLEVLSTGGTDTSTSHASAIKETAGATGSLTWTQTNAASGSIAYAIIPAAEGGAFEINAASGSYALSGVTAGTLSTRLINAATGSYASTGAVAGTSLGRYLASDPGVYAVTGTVAQLVATRLFAADPGSYTLTGVTAGIVADRLFDAAPGAYALTGLDAELVYEAITGYTLDAAPGTYALTGSAAGLLAARLLNADPGSYAVTGTAATILAGRLLSADPGVYELTGADSALLATRLLAAAAGSYTLTGADAELLHTLLVVYSLDAEPGAYVLTGIAATLAAGRLFSAAPGAYLLSGFAAAFARGQQLTLVDHTDAALTLADHTAGTLTLVDASGDTLTLVDATPASLPLVDHTPVDP